MKAVASMPETPPDDVQTIEPYVVTAPFFERGAGITLTLLHVPAEGELGTSLLCI